ncbi:hypothetical protein [Paenibacillus sp. OAE614]
MNKKAWSFDQAFIYLVFGDFFSSFCVSVKTPSLNRTVHRCDLSLNFIAVGTNILISAASLLLIASRRTCSSDYLALSGFMLGNIDTFLAPDRPE